MLLPTTTYRTTAFVAAAKRLDADLTVASERPSTFEAARPDALLTLDCQDLDRATEGAVAFHRRHPVTAALGVDDDTVIAAAAINAAIGARGNAPEAVTRARDKHAQRVACATAGVPVPAFSLHALGGPMPHPRFPSVVKPLRLAASRGVMRVNDAHELATALVRVAGIVGAGGAVLLEDYVPGVEVALEGLLVDGRLHRLAVFDKPDRLEGPFFEESIYVTPSRLPVADVDRAWRVAEGAAAALGLRDGPVHVEVRLHGSDAWLVELAARPIGGRCSAALRFDDGATLEELVCRHALGLPLGSLVRERGASGVMMIPVPGAGELREVQGVAAARGVPGIEGVDITAHPGERLVPWPEGSRYPGFIFARADNAAGVEAALRDAHARLRFVLD